MIFVTIGIQAPFDRLIKVIDEIAPLLKGYRIIAQASKGIYKPQNMQMFEFLDPKDFNKYFTEAKLVIGHAGMGTIISALVMGKPIIAFPRLLQFGEHRNNHQMATAQKFAELNYINVAYTEEELKIKIITMLNSELRPLHKIGAYASDELIKSIKKFIDS